MMNDIKSALYDWQGMDLKGNLIEGRDYAQSHVKLKCHLLSKQILLKSATKQSTSWLWLKRYRSSKQILFFLTQLAALLKTGIHLTKAIDLLSHNKLDKQQSTMLTNIQQQLAQGNSLSFILSQYPQLFDAVIIQFIKSGESTGKIDPALEQAIYYYAQKIQTINQILTVLLYPMMLGIVTIAVLITMGIFVIPQFEEIYSQSNTELPSLTRFILDLSTVIKEQYAIFILVFALLIVIGHYLSRYQRVDIATYIPSINKAIKKINTLRFCQTLSGLYHAGLPITICLESVKNLSPSLTYRNAINLCLEEIGKGNSLAQALGKSDYFDPILIQLIKTGEESASLSQMLKQCAQYYDDQLQQSIARLKILLEPILIVFLGSVIGVILIAMYLPVFNLGASF